MSGLTLFMLATGELDQRRQAFANQLQQSTTGATAAQVTGELQKIVLLCTLQFATAEQCSQV